jgi:hypothetical protein
MKFTFGSDPEFFLSNKKEYISAIKVLPPQENPLKINKNLFYYDNTLAEVAIKPSKTLNEAMINIKNCLTDIKSAISPYKMEIQAFAEYNPNQLDDLDSKVVACNPEWSIYKFEEILPPKSIVNKNNEFKVNYRTAGGHIHVGQKRLVNSVDLIYAIRMMDLFLGIPSVALDKNPKSKSRKQIYGKSGSHRIKPYGFEYRVLSNYWFNSPEHVSLIYKLTEFTLEFVKNKQHEKFWDTNEDFSKGNCGKHCVGYELKSLIKCINESDESLCESFMKIIEKIIPSNLMKEITRLSKKKIIDYNKSWQI